MRAKKGGRAALIRIAIEAALLDLGHHIIDRRLDIGVCERRIAALGRHAVESLQCVLVKRWLAFGNTDSPYTLVASLWRTGNTCRMTSQTSGFVGSNLCA